MNRVIIMNIYQCGDPHIYATQGEFLFALAYLFRESSVMLATC